jgi:diacylglycerol kinase (ATP)
VLAVVGGDGSVHHAVRGLLDAGGGSRAAIPLAVFAAGTGNDFVKSIAAPAHDPQAMAACVGRGHAPLLDVGLLDSVPFVNAAGFGFRAALATGRTADRALTHRRLLTVLANGRCFGGAFRIAPGADPADGQLDLVDVGDVAPWARVPIFWRATRGRHLTTRGVHHLRCDRFAFAFDAPPMFQADGELYRAEATQVSASVLPAALPVIAAG